MKLLILILLFLIICINSNASTIQSGGATMQPKGSITATSTPAIADTVIRNDGSNILRNDSTTIIRN